MLNIFSALTLIGSGFAFAFGHSQEATFGVLTAIWMQGAARAEAEAEAKAVKRE